MIIQHYLNMKVASTKYYGMAWKESMKNMFINIEGDTPAKGIYLTHILKYKRTLTKSTNQKFTK